jgi:UDP-2,3-diacylglucosamine hydrolase
VFFVGDIFDYWFEYNTVVPKHFYRTLSKIYDLKKQGIKITYLMGNHDFGHNSFFKEEFDIEIITTDLDITIDNKKIYIAHGDGKAYNDTGYLILKKVLRAKLSNILFRILHPDIGIGLASGSSRQSRTYTDKKEFSQKDGLKDFAIKKIEEGYDYVIMGHRHKKEYIKHIYQNKSNIEKSGTYINLGEWFNDPQVGVFDGKDFQLISVNNFLC